MERLYVRDVCASCDEGAERSETVKPFATHPLTIAELQVAGADIVDERVTEDVIESLCLADAPGAATDDHRKLGFVIHLRTDSGQDNRRVMGAERIRKLVKNEWRGG